MAESAVAPLGWERAMLALEKVKDRLRRVTQALAQAGVPYAVVGGNAVAEWVGRVDETAVRNTRDVDILIRRADLDAIRAALEKAILANELRRAFITDAISCFLFFSRAATCRR